LPQLDWKLGEKLKANFLSDWVLFSINKKFTLYARTFKISFMLHKQAYVTSFIPSVLDCQVLSIVKKIYKNQRREEFKANRKIEKLELRSRTEAIICET
jgi:uncharacterized protein YpbB